MDKRWARLIVVVMALAVAGCASSETPPSDAAPPALAFDIDDVAAEPSDGRAPRSGGAVAPEPQQRRAPTVVGPPLAWPSQVATVAGPEIWSRPTPADEAGSLWFPNPTQFGGPRVFRVVDATSDPDLIQVSLPSMPNGQLGWIPRDEVTVTEVDHQVVVDLGARTVTVWDGDEMVMTHSAVVGTPWTPTPTGVFYVRDIIRQPDSTGSYGPYIVALSGFSEVLDTFNGGLPAIALHGTNNPDAMGRRQSNGCVRLPNNVIELVAGELPLGTPVTIVADTIGAPSAGGGHPQ